MNATLNGKNINVATIAAILLNNREVTIDLPLTTKTGILITRNESHFVGYKKQDVISVCFYESDGIDDEVTSTEYFNTDMIESASKAALERHASEDPTEASNYSVSFENTFIKIDENVIDFEMADISPLDLNGLPTVKG